MMQYRRPGRSGLTISVLGLLGLLTYWPLGGGLLTGKYRPGRPAPDGSRLMTQPIFQRSFTPQRLEFAGEFASTAAECGLPPSALALAWVLSRPGVDGVLAGATTEEQLQQNLEALQARVDDDVFSRFTTRTEDSVHTPFRPAGTTGP